MTTIHGILAGGPAYKFRLRLNPDTPDPTAALILVLESTSTDEAAAAGHVADTLSRMGISWLRPIDLTEEWHVNRSDLAAALLPGLKKPSWLVGEESVRPIFETVQRWRQPRVLVRFYLSAPGPLAPGVMQENAWVKVERLLEKVRRTLDYALEPEDYQAIGLLCREVVICLGAVVSERSGAREAQLGNAKEHLERYVERKLPGKPNERLRKYAKSVWDLAVHIQHDQMADIMDAALCAEATDSLVRLVSILEKLDLE